VAKSVTVGPLFVVCWDGTVTVDDQQSALAGLRSAARARPGPLVMVVVLGESLHPPAAEVRKQGLEMIRSALALASALEVVVAGRGVLGTLQRSTARGVALVIPELRGRVHVHESLRAAVQHAATVVDFAMAEVVQPFARAGLSL
jgi:hypothetical protein